MATRSSAAPQQIVIIGSGPAGLGCAYELIKQRPDRTFSITILDKNNLVGGLARTHMHKGYAFDVGPHRFFTKNEEVLALWKEVLGDSFIEVPRLTRILYRNKLFNYPIQLKDVVSKLGPKDSLGSLISFIYARLVLRKRKASTFEEWITQNFGKRLFQMFFKTYTEKVWGIPCNEIGAEWAAQRIKNLDFVEVVRSAIFKKKSKAKSLVDKFYYPVEGAGQMYEAMAKRITEAGHTLILGAEVTEICHEDGRLSHLTYLKNGKLHALKTDHLFSSMPLTHFVYALKPPAEKSLVEAADKLYYRDHITVNLVIDKEDLFPDNWIYVHSPEVRMARIANYNNFSDAMRPEKGHTGISVEYFVFQKDDLWQTDDEGLIRLAIKEMETVGFLSGSDVVDGFVIRETESYPTYYTGHKEHFDKLKKYVSSFENLQLIGRGGMYKYNNMDHSIYSGMLAARNYLEGRRRYDVWEINEDAEYLEEITEVVPSPASAK